MFKKLGRMAENVADDFGYFAKRSSVFMLGKIGGQVAGEGLGLAAGIALGTLAVFDSGSVASAISTTLAVGAVAGVSGALVHADFKHRRNQLVDRYREEAGKLLEKAPDKVTEQDMEIISRGDFKRGIDANPTIKQELKTSWLERNVGVVLSAVVAAATFLIVHALDGINPYGVEAFIKASGTAAEGASLPSFIASQIGNAGVMMTLAGKLAVNGLAGFATYHAIKTPLHWAASEILGIEEDTVNDRITDIKRGLGRGHEITPEQILGVFIQAHHDVAEQLKADYGKHYDDMDAAEQANIVGMMQRYMDIRGLTEDINKGRMRPEELAFTTFGQRSGIEKSAEGTYQQHGKSFFDGMWKGLQAITGGFTGPARETNAREMQEHLGELPGSTEIKIHAPNAYEASMDMRNEFEEPGRKQSFTARIGRKVEQDGLSHVERLEQSSNQSLVFSR